MKKIIFYAFVLFLICLFIWFLKKDYKIDYKVGNHDIFVEYKNKRYYFEIDKKYNFDFYYDRGISKLKIDSIETIEGENFICIVPNIKKINTYPLCYQNNEYIDFYLIDDDKLDSFKQKNDTVESKKNFEYYKNLDDETYVSLWKYNGYYIMHNGKIDEVNLISNDRYDNTLAYGIENKILMPNYEEKYEFDSFILLDVKSLKTINIDSKYTISYDAYICGFYKNKVYLYDNKYESLYTIDIKTKVVSLIGNEEIGFVKLQKGHLVTAKKSEYKNKLTYFDNKTNYKYITDETGTFKIFNNNKDLKLKILNYKVDKIYEKDNVIYYIYKDDLYSYSSEYGSKKIFHYFELNFVKDNNFIIFNS